MAGLCLVLDVVRYAPRGGLNSTAGVERELALSELDGSVNTVYQVDLVPTLAMLLGTPIP